jgi:hypothetical protein
MSPDQISMLDELLSYDGGSLNGWEIDFLESLDKRRDDIRPLSEKQDDKLRQTWDKIFGT